MLLVWRNQIVGGNMGIRMLNNCGYTLMELIMAMAAVAAISAAAIPNYTRYLASAREDVCMLNRQTIIYEYHLYSINEPVSTLSDYLDTYYEGTEGHLCPLGGTYAADGSGESAVLTCSIHQD